MNALSKDTPLIYQRQYDWIDRLQIGDVLVDPHGTARVVRAIARWRRRNKDAELRVQTVHFSILRCSWTQRPVTVLFRSDLRSRKFRPTGIRVRLGTKMDKLIAVETKCLGLPKLTCCDVKGIQ